MPNVDPAWPIQTALVARLAGVLVDLDGGPVPVVDHVTEGTPFPYVVAGEAIVNPDNTHDGFGHRTPVTLHVWSAYHGHREALAIAGQIVALLDEQPLPIAGMDTVAVRHEQTLPLRDPDADLRHTVVRFAITTDTTA